MVAFIFSFLVRISSPITLPFSNLFSRRHSPPVKHQTGVSQRKVGHRSTTVGSCSHSHLSCGPIAAFPLPDDDHATPPVEGVPCQAEKFHLPRTQGKKKGGFHRPLQVFGKLWIQSPQIVDAGPAAEMHSNAVSSLEKVFQGAAGASGELSRKLSELEVQQVKMAKTNAQEAYSRQLVAVKKQIGDVMGLFSQAATITQRDQTVHRKQQVMRMNQGYRAAWVRKSG